MNNTRIRYDKTDNILISRRVFVNADNISFRVILDTENMKYRIINASTEDLIKEGGKTKNLAVLKIQAKDALKSLGVSFQSETRNRSDQSMTASTVTSKDSTMAAQVNG